MQKPQETTERTERLEAGPLALDVGVPRSGRGPGHSPVAKPAWRHFHASVPSVLSCWLVKGPGQAVSMQLHGDHTRLACRRRRLGDDHLAQTLELLNGDRNSERLKCSASRRARHASGVRSPSCLHRYG